MPFLSVRNPVAGSRSSRTGTRNPHDFLFRMNCRSLEERPDLNHAALMVCYLSPARPEIRSHLSLYDLIVSNPARGGECKERFVSPRENLRGAVNDLVAGLHPGNSGFFPCPARANPPATPGFTCSRDATRIRYRGVVMARGVRFFRENSRVRPAGTSPFPQSSRMPEITER